MKLPAPRTVWRQLPTPRILWRRLRIALIPLVLYLALHPIAAALSARQGFGSPDGAGPTYLAITAAVLALRLMLLIVVPAILTYRAVVYAVTRGFPRTP
ncbi:hypothetical protein [Nocardia sp. NPDC051832]|uniref:hypothetical protein n=1 Tax=Nocardia sp. NPDC051832 TaxID=3155673 RepID=UPI0034215037